MVRIQNWIATGETHSHDNAIALVMICQGADNFDLMSYDGQAAFTVRGLVDRISKTSTLIGKPKLINIQKCVLHYETAPGKILYSRTQELLEVNSFFLLNTSRYKVFLYPKD